MRVVFRGASDDLIEIEGKIAGADEYSGSGLSPTPTGIDIYRIVIGNGKESTEILGFYSGGWGFLPNYQDDTPDTVKLVSVTRDDYSCVTTIDVPDDYVVMSVNGEKTKHDPKVASAIAALSDAGLDDEQVARMLRDRRAR